MDNRTVPQSMRHKRILNLAADNPDDSIDALADRVPSATPDLVEHVLGKYGDPAEASPTDGGTTTDTASDDATPDTSPPATSDAVTAADDAGETADEPDTGTADAPSDATTGTADSDSGTEPSPGTDEQTIDDSSPSVTDADDTADDTDESALLDIDSLSDKQQDTLRAIADRPEATQREIAATLDVTAPTVSTRLSDVPGFQWNDRQSFVDTIDLSPTETTASMNDDIQQSIDELSERLRAVEDQLETSGSDDTDDVDPELVQKLVHACRNSDDISEAEELRLLEQVME